MSEKRCMAQEQDVLKGVDLTGDRYTVKQRFFRNKYDVYDEQGELVLTTKQKLFKMKEEFPFVDSEGNPVFHIKAQSVLDIAGDYTLTEAGTGDVLAVLSKKFTIFLHTWKVKDSEGNVLAIIRNKNKLLGMMRSFVGVTNIIPHSYSIETPDGKPIGTIQGKFSIRDTYEIRIDESETMPKEALVASAIAVDALEGN